MTRQRHPEARSAEGSRDPRYLEYFRLFREEKFFEAHEVLEGLWRETRGPEREFYHGLIQLAASLVHFQKGNLAGGKELFRTASRYLEPYLPQSQGVDLERVLGDFKQFFEAWSRHPEESSLARRFLPRLELKR